PAFQCVSWRRPALQHGDLAGRCSARYGDQDTHPSDGRMRNLSWFRRASWHHTGHLYDLWWSWSGTDAARLFLCTTNLSQVSRHWQDDQRTMSNLSWWRSRQAT